MFRLFAALTLLFLNLQACKGGYDSCKHKIIDSKSLDNTTASIPITKHKRVLFSHTKPNAKILKYDPYLSLYLIEDTKGFKYPFKIQHQPVLGTACVNKKSAIEGRIKEHQIGLNQFGIFSEPTQAPSLLLTSCCSLEGLVTPEGIIEKAYLERFMKIKKVAYSDIGIRVRDEKKHVLVNAINPFLDANEFKIGDTIIKFDRKKVKDSAQLMRWILFSKIGSPHTILIKREGKYKTLHMKSSKRNGGGYLSDTFLEFLGISFDLNLNIIKIEQKAKKYQLKIGDKLLQINHKKITTQGEILKMISDSKESPNLLFEREGFQFFVKIKSI